MFEHVLALTMKNARTAYVEIYHLPKSISDFKNLHFPSFCDIRTMLPPLFLFCQHHHHQHMNERSQNGILCLQHSQKELYARNRKKSGYAVYMSWFYHAFGNLSAKMKKECMGRVSCPRHASHVSQSAKQLF